MKNYDKIIEIIAQVCDNGHNITKGETSRERS